MTTKRREAVGNTFREHDATKCGCKFVRVIGVDSDRDGVSFQPCPKLLDGLAALSPEPVKTLDRESVKEILLKHHIIYTGLLDDLCALAIPEPSDLIKAAKRVIEVVKRPGMKDPFDDGWSWYYRLYDAIEGSPKSGGVREWCEHHVRYVDGKWHRKLGIVDLPGAALQENPVPNNEDICPVAGCHAPRPKEGG